MAEYQHASDFIYGMTPFSGVIRVADGKFIANAADSQEWADYLTWAETEGNVPDPYLAPEAGGAVLTLAEDEVPVGTMHDSLPLADEITTPRMVDIPALTGTPAVGETLTVTMGNWEGEPTDYDAQWVYVDTETKLGTGPEHVVTEADQGHDIACIVTAINSFGSTRAKMSNPVTIPAAVPPVQMGFDDGVTTDTTTRHTRRVAEPEPVPEPPSEPEAEHHRGGRHRGK